MAPYLDTVKSFADVPVTEAGVDTKQFLEASEGVVGLFDILGSAAFIPVQTDLRGNIAKVRTRYEADPVKSATLQLLVEDERHEKKRIATEGLMWLVRGLSFTCNALLNAESNKSQELSESFVLAYDATLKKFHNFVVKAIFAVALKACPHRSDFYAKLSKDPHSDFVVAESTLHEQLDKWLVALKGIVEMIETFYEKGGHGKGF